MSVRRVLLIAYHFPPVGGAGTQRPLKFARYLPMFGFAPTIVTGSGSKRGRWLPADDTFLHETRSMSVIRVAEIEPVSAKWPARLRRMLVLRDGWEDWWIEQIVAEVDEAGEFELIWATGPPYGTLEAAATLARRYGRPWVADLRDLWALDEMELYPTWAHRRLDKRRMARTLTSASAIVTTARTAAAALREEMPALAARVLTVTNGFDPADFTSLTPERPPERFRIVHTGYLHTEEGRRQRRLTRRLLGGTQRHAQILTRSHVYLLEAIRRLLNEDPTLATRLEVCFAGVLSTADREVAARLPVTRILGYLSHLEAIGLMQSADLLFLPMQKTAGQKPSTTLPGKTFEYLASGRPILAAMPPGDAHEILSAAGADVCAPDDVDGMADVIRSHLAGAVEVQRHRCPRSMRAFEREELTGALAAEFSRVLEAATDSDAPLRASSGIDRGMRYMSAGPKP